MMGKISTNHNKSTKIMQIRQDENHSLNIKLKSALRYALHTFVFGAVNKFSDQTRTNFWVAFISHRYKTTGDYILQAEKPRTWKFCTDKFNHYTTSLKLTQEKKNPLYDPKFNLTHMHKLLLQTSIIALETRSGNCNERSCVVAKYLWENPTDIKKIEMVSLPKLDHVFIVVNRCGDIHDPNSWGNAWIIDSWYGKNGLVFHASELSHFMPLIVAFMTRQRKMFEMMNIYLKTEQQTTFKTEWSIIPTEHLYPSYDKSTHVEEYYRVIHAYPNKVREGREISFFRKACLLSYSLFQDEIQYHPQQETLFLENKKQHAARFFPTLNRIKENNIVLKKTTTNIPSGR